MWKILILTLCFANCLKDISGTGCDSLTGKWYNQLGSELIFHESQSHRIEGEFRTAVERREGAAGHKETHIKGVTALTSTDKLFGFSAVFNGGKSVTSWIGHCMKCGDEEKLHTTWLLKSTVDTCLSQWKSIMVNEDNFIRHDKVSGPRKHLNWHTPTRSPNWVAPKQSDRGTYQSNLRGKWYTADGIEIDLSVNETLNLIEGTFLEPDGKILPVYGTLDPRNTNGAFGLHAAWEAQKSAQIWVGQYHYCEGGKEVLETSWLKRTGAATCKRDMQPTMIGRMTFLRTPPAKNQPEQTWTFQSAVNNMASKISNFFSNLF